MEVRKAHNGFIITKGGKEYLTRSMGGLQNKIRLLFELEEREKDIQKKAG